LPIPSHGTHANPSILMEAGIFDFAIFQRPTLGFRTLKKQGALVAAEGSPS